MAVIKEAIETRIVEAIVNFDPGKRKPGEFSRGDEVGRVGKDFRLAYGVLPYQERAVDLPGQPLVQRWTNQPILALVSGRRTITLVYPADVETIGKKFATQVVEAIESYKNR